MANLLLASASPRRRELLAQLALTFEVAPTDVDETVRPGESPAVYTQRLATEKALAGFSADGRKRPALGADTIVLLDGEILCKPGSREEAVDMLQRLSGRTHEVFSGVSLALGDDRVLEALNVTRVTFGEMPRDWIRRYCRSDEPMDKAGAYAVQGATARFIRCIDGSYSGVMGLPLFETAALLHEGGVLD